MSRILIFIVLLAAGRLALAATGEETLSLNGVWKFKTAASVITHEPGDIVVDNADQGDYGTSGWSQTIAVTPNGQLPPPTPMLCAGVRGDQQISLRFEPSEAARSYRIRYDKTGEPAAQIAEIDAAAVT